MKIFRSPKKNKKPPDLTLKMPFNEDINECLELVSRRYSIAQRLEPFSAVMASKLSPTGFYGYGDVLIPY